MYFVLTWNPNTGARFPLTNEDGIVKMFDTRAAAVENAWRTQFGAAGYYEIYHTEKAT
jgi:hypothetical protein